MPCDIFTCNILRLKGGAGIIKLLSISCGEGQAPRPASQLLKDALLKMEAFPIVCLDKDGKDNCQLSFNMEV